MNFMPINIKLDLTPIAQSLAAIMDSGHKGVAKLAGLFVNRAFADAIRNQALQDAQNHSDGEAIRRGEKRFEDGVLMDVLPNTMPNGVVGLLGNAINVEEVSNFVKALGRTAELLENIPQQLISDEPIQKTFFNRWRKEAERIDDETLRILWSQILAHEVAAPGSISFRTMDVVRNLSLKEAQTFQRMIKGEIEGVIPRFGNGHPQFVKYHEVLSMQDAGLLTAQQSTITFDRPYSIDGKRKGTVIVLPTKDFVVYVDAPSLKLDCYVLTDAGESLLKIAQDKRTVEDYIEVLEEIAKKHSKLTISLHSVLSAQCGQVAWAATPLWARNGETVSKT